MKFTYSAPAIVIIVLSLACAAGKKNQPLMVNVPAEQKTIYRDGIYTGTSRAAYTDEPFWGIVRVKVEKGSIAGVDFAIRDSSLHEPFDEKYEKHYAGNQLYVQQCRNDWNGVKNYPKKLAESGNPDKVDVISGATWSYNIFRASLDEALKKAVK